MVRLYGVVFLVSALCLLPTLGSNADFFGRSTNAESGPQNRTRTRRQQKPRINYSEFSHTTHVIQQKLGCDACHKFPTSNWKEVRTGDAAFADVAEFPDHDPCLNCHRKQFFARERPAPAICSNCHVRVTPLNTTRFLFDSLGDVSDPAKQRREVIPEFSINFSHDKHVDVVEARARRNGFITVSWQEKNKPAEPAETKSCPVCHQTYQPQGDSDEEYATKPPENLGENFWLKKGAFKTTPNSHTVCFTCHNTDVGIEPAPSNCQVCHKLAVSQTQQKTDFDPKLAQTIGPDRTALQTWSKRTSSGTFRHEGGEHPNMSCLQCHSVSTPETNVNALPVKSCGGADGCHVTATADDGGILNYEIDQKKGDAAFVCTKCHITFGKEPVPASHLNAIPKPK